MFTQQTHKQLSNDSRVIPLGLTDHMIRKHKHPKVHHKHTEIQYRSYKTFQQSLRQVPWSTLEEVNDPYRALFMDLYTGILDNHAPIKTKRIKTDSAPWLNDHIITAMQNRDSVHEQAPRYNTSELWLAYRNSKNNVVTQIRLAKEEYYWDIIKENMHNSKSLWNSLKLLLLSKLKRVAKYFIINDELETNPKAIATAFTDFLLVSVIALQKLLWVVKHLFLNVEYQ